MTGARVIHTAQALVDEVVEIVYADVDGSVWSAAAMSVRAQLAYLTARR